MSLYWFGRWLTLQGDRYLTTFTRGTKFFELTNHLGNVLVTVTDKKIGVRTGSDTTRFAYYAADIASAQDYYPGGMLEPGRSFNSSSYRYGAASGQEKDNEIKGEGNSYTAQFWEYDPRSVRRWNLDPKPTVGISQYSVFSGNPIRYSDPLGDTLQPLTTDVLRTMARKSGFTGTGIVFNRRVGKAFESIGLAEQGSYENTTRYTSQERTEATAGITTTVIPDGMRDVKEIRTQLFPPGLKTTVYPNSSVFEVKAVSGVISLSTSNYQIQGELDVVKNSSGGRVGRGTMTFVTTANTFIGADVIEYAQKNRIQLYQVFSFRETDDNSIHFTPPLPLNNASQYNQSINITPLARVVDIRFGYSLNPTWTRPENPANPDVEEVQ